MDKVILRTDRLVLEAPSFEDVDSITAACQDPEIQRRVPIPVPYTRSDAEGYVHSFSNPGWESNQRCTWAIKVDGEMSGAISLDGIESGQAQIGYWMTPLFRGRGLLTEAAQAVVDFGFALAPNGLGLKRIEWHAYAGNIASARVARRVGFQFEGTLRLGAMGRLGREDDWVAGILADDVRSHQPWSILP